MVLGAYLTVDQKQLPYNDYSSSNKLTGTIYTTESRTTAFNLTGYTLKVRLYKRWFTSDYFGKTANITVAASGTWNYPIAQNECPPPGLYLIEIEMSQSGEVFSTFPEEIIVRESPS